MTKIFVICGICIFCGAAGAACPDKYDEVHMENITITTDASCPAGTAQYYEINDMCNAHVY